MVTLLADSGGVPKGPRREEVKFTLRLPPALDRAVRGIAAATRRSVNAQLEVAVRYYVEAWRRGQTAEPEAPSPESSPPR
jgi:hypothetical protein